MKHSKYLNSGLIANTVEKIVISKIAENDSKVVKKFHQYINVIKSLPMIKEELNIFDELNDTCVERKALANKLLAEVKKDIHQKDWRGRDKQRQIFYDKVRVIFPEINEHLKQYIKDYKSFASIKNFIDDTIDRKLSAKERLIVEESIIENMCSNKKINNQVQMISEANEIPEEIDHLATHIMVRDFCKKWQSTLSPTQFQYLVAYASNGDVINEEWSKKIHDKLDAFDIGSIKSEETSEKTSRLINEVKKKTQLSNIEILEYAELVDSLSEVTKAE